MNESYHGTLGDHGVTAPIDVHLMVSPVDRIVGDFIDAGTHILQHTATHCNTLQHTATHCNTLQHTATHSNPLLLIVGDFINAAMGWLPLVGLIKL